WRIAPDVAGEISHLAAPRMFDDRDVWNNTDPSNAYAIPSTTNDYRSNLAAVKSLIAADAAAATAAGSQLKAIVIVGHVTVPYSGLTDYDNHVNVSSGGPGRAMPTDQYYADVDGTAASWGDTTANYTSF